MNRYCTTRNRYLSILAAALTIIAGSAFAETKAPPRVTVTWAPNSQLTEVKQNPSHRGWMRPNEWQHQLAKYLRQRADKLLPNGQHLHVKITNIKLAGDFEPWLGPNMQDVRIIKDIYPPRIDLHFTLTGADGKTISEGDRKLRDLAFLQHPIVAFSSTDPLRYDKRLLRDWLQREFGQDKT